MDKYTARPNKKVAHSPFAKKPFALITERIYCGIVSAT